jgi:hypothetical protein
VYGRHRYHGRQMKESVMETNKGLQHSVNENDRSGAWRGRRSSGRKSLVILTIALLMLIGSAGALTKIWTVNSVLDAVTGAVAPDGPPAAPYFPSQYVNQATENSEHIQAF